MTDEITAVRRAAERGPASRDDELALAREIIDNAVEAIFHLDSEGRVTFANPAAEALFGWPLDELYGRKLHDAVHYRRVDGTAFPMSECPLGHVFATGQTLKGHEDTFFHRDGTPIEVACSNAAVRVGGRVTGSVLVVRDVGERKREEARRQLLVHELNHRVKNMLSVVQSIARQSFRERSESGDLEAFEARLLALSAAHNLLTDQGWERASLRSLAEKVLEPFATENDRLVLAGPELALTPNAVVAIAMTLHELATNAVKYGALSDSSGTVELAWAEIEAETGGVVKLRWEERGGPPVRKPTRRGFGSRMISTVARQWGGDSRLIFDPAGFAFELQAPSHALVLPTALLCATPSNARSVEPCD